MPAFINSPFKPAPKLLIPGHPTSLWGSFNTNVPPTRAWVTSVALASNVATVTVQILEGNIPVVPTYGTQTISIQGTASEGGVFNVSEVTVTSVSFNATTGIGTVVFPLTGTNLATTADGGTAIMEQPQVAEALVNGASQSVACSNAQSAGANARTLSAQVIFPSIPTTVTTVTLQGSLYDVASEYEDIGTVASVAAGVVTGGNYSVTGLAWRFYRFNTTGVSGGTNPSIFASLEC